MANYQGQLSPSTYALAKQATSASASAAAASAAQAASFVGAPLKAAALAEMTDTTKIYVYTGSETGYTSGHWYYWNGSAWTDGGAYFAAPYTFDAAPTDGSTNPVESNGIYDALANVNNALSEEIGDLNTAFTKTNNSQSVQLSFEQGNIKNTGLESSDSTRIRTGYLYCPLGFTFSIPSGYKAYFRYFGTTEYTSIVRSSDSWETGDVSHYFADVNYVRIIYAYTGDGDISPSDITNPVYITLVSQTDKTLSLENVPADAKATGDMKAILNQNLFKTESLIFDSLYLSADVSASVTQEESYQQILFDAVPAGEKYLFVIVTNTAITFDSVRFMHGTSEVGTRFTNGSSKPNEPAMFALDYSAGTQTINRIRIYNVSAAATIRMMFIPITINHMAITSSVLSMDKIGNFFTNKAANATWISGKSVQAQNLNRISSDSNYYIKHLTVKKGDLIRIYYPNADHTLNNARYALSERIIWGTGDDNSSFRGIYIGGPRELLYVAEKDMLMTIGGQESSYLPEVYQYAVGAYAESAEFGARRFQRFPYGETMLKLAITKASYNNYQNSRPKPLTLLHFSDIHNSAQNADAIKLFMSLYGSYLNDAICTGDMTGQNFATYMPIYAQEGYQSILLAIGNHDVYDVDGTHDSDSEAYWATATQKYNQYFAPSVDEWGTIVQPADAATNGLCYYYKDYSSNGYGYRLIVLDAMAYNDDQHNWFVSALTDAKTNSMTVVVAEHFPPITGLSDITAFDTPFMSMLTGMEYNYAVGRLTATAGNALDAVDTFINGGGEFACWICGHMHYDQIGKITSHPNQIFVAVASANRSAVWADQPRYIDTPSEDLFNVICIDPYLKIIKIQRFGAVVDDWGRMHDHVSVNYATRTLIATS